MLTKVVELVAKEMLQSLTLRIALLGVLLKPCVVLKRASRILLAPGDNLREQFLSLRNITWLSVIYKIYTQFYTQKCKIGCFLLTVHKEA